MSLKSGFHNCVVKGIQRRTQGAKNMTEAVSLWIQREHWWYLLSFILEPIWHSLSVSCDKNLSFVLKPVKLFYRLRMRQPSCLHYGSKFLTHPSWWWQRDKPFAFLFCFTLSQECLRNSIPVPNEELVFKHISAYLRALLLRNWEKICVHIRRIKMMLFLLFFCGIFTVGVELIFSCRSALLSLEEQRQGQAAVLPRTVRDFAHFALRCRYGCTGPIGIGQIGASCCSSTEAGGSHHPSGSHRDAGGSVLPAVCWWLGGQRQRGVRCNSSLNFPWKPKPPAPVLAPSPRGSPQAGGSSWRSLILWSLHLSVYSLFVFQWILGLVSMFYGPTVAVVIANRFPTAAFKQGYFMSLCNLGWCFPLWRLHFMLRCFQPAVRKHEHF